MVDWLARKHWTTYRNYNKVAWTRSLWYNVMFVMEQTYVLWCSSRSGLIYAPCNHLWTVETNVPVRMSFKLSLIKNKIVDRQICSYIEREVTNEDWPIIDMNELSLSFHTLFNHRNAISSSNAKRNSVQVDLNWFPNFYFGCWILAVMMIRTLCSRVALPWIQKR